MAKKISSLVCLLMILLSLFPACTKSPEAGNNETDGRTQGTVTDQGEFSHYVNESYGLQFDFPTGWTVTEQLEKSTLSVAPSTSVEGKQLDVEITLRELTDGIDAKSMTQDYINELHNALLEKFNLLASQVLFDEQRGNMGLIFSEEIEDDVTYSRTYYLFLLENGEIAICRATALVDDMEGAEICTGILDSIFSYTQA